MKSLLLTAFYSLGWILFLVLIASSYLIEKYSSTKHKFVPIQWKQQQSVFDGIIACTLSNGELQKRVDKLKVEVFSNRINLEETSNGYIYYFEDKDSMTNKLMELIIFEKGCCPFFKFDLSILPFNKGLALQISGNTDVKEFLTEFNS